METDGHPQDFLSKSDSKEFEIDVGSKLADIITEANNSFNCIIKLHEQYLKDKYDEVEDEDNGEKYMGNGMIRKLRWSKNTKKSRRMNKYRNK